MDSIKCKALLKAIDLGSMSAAAEVLGYTPSGIVRMVNALEAEFGVSLINRTNQGIVPTKEGERIIPSLREVVYHADTAQQIAADIKGLDVGDLRVGALYSISSTLLPRVIKEFSSDYPGIHIDVFQGLNYELTEMIDNKQLDCSIMSGKPSNGDWLTVGEDRFVAMVPSDSPLAQRSYLPVSELGQLTFIYPYPKHNDQLEDYLRKHNVTLNIAYSAEDNFSIFSMVEAGLGISVNNELACKKWQGSVTRIPLSPTLIMPVGIYVSSFRNAPPAVKKFITYVQKIAQED